METTRFAAIGGLLKVMVNMLYSYLLWTVVDVKALSYRGHVGKLSAVLFCVHHFACCAFVSFLEFEYVIANLLCQIFSYTYRYCICVKNELSKSNTSSILKPVTITVL